MENIIVIKKNRTYYFKSTAYLPTLTAENGRVNGKPVEVCPGDRLWFRCDEMPEKLERLKPAERRFLHFELMERFPETEVMPRQVGFDFFGMDDIYDEPMKNEELRGLYEAQWTTLESSWETLNVSFQLVDEDCEPLLEPAFNFVSEFPFKLDFHPVAHYKYPCSITSSDAFDYVRKELLAHLDTMTEEARKQYEVSYTRDYHFTIKLNALVEHGETYEHSYYTSRSAKKPKKEIRPLRTIATYAVALRPARSSSSTGDVVPAFKAENYFALKAKLDEFVANYKEALNGSVVVCAYCKGYGVVNTNNRKKRGE